MNPMQNKTPEERKAIAAKGQATARARREAEESARQDAMTRAEWMRRAGSVVPADAWAAFKLGQFGPQP